jgi:hypothetical protein
MKRGEEDDLDALENDQIIHRQLGELSVLAQHARRSNKSKGRDIEGQGTANIKKVSHLIRIAKLKIVRTNLPEQTNEELRHHVHRHQGRQDKETASYVVKYLVGLNPLPLGV